MSDDVSSYPGTFLLVAGLTVLWLGAFVVAVATNSDPLLEVLVLSAPTTAMAVALDLRGYGRTVSGHGSLPWTAGVLFLFPVLAPLYVARRKRQLDPA